MPSNFLKSLFKDRVIALFFSFGVILSLFLTFIVPPFQKADEITHFHRAISVASGTLVCPKDSNGVFVNNIPSYLARLPHDTYFDIVRSDTNSSLPKSLLFRLLLNSEWSSKPTNVAYSCVLPFIHYLPVGLILALPVSLGLNPIFIFFLGRLTNTIISLILFYFAVKIIPRKLKLVPLFILSLPMVLHQISSFSKDALHISFGVLAISYLFYFLKKKTLVKKEELIVFFTSLLMTVSARPQYFLLAFLPFLIPFEKVERIKHTRLPIKILSFVFILLLGGLIIWLLSTETYSANANSYVGDSAPLIRNGFVYPELQLKYLQKEPLKFIEILDKTLNERSNFYIETLVGGFGWLEYKLSWFINFVYFALFTIVFIKTRRHFPNLSKVGFIILNLVMVGSVVGIFLSFYLYGSSVSTDVVGGVQGRYFIILLPLLLWSLSLVDRYFKGKLLGVILVFVLASIMSTVGMRYYSTLNHYHIERQIYDETPFTKDDYILVQNKVKQKFNIQPGQKLRGLSFYVFSGNRVTKPYLLTIYDKDCHITLREKVIDVEQIEVNELNNFLFKPLEGEEELCFELGPYATTVLKQESLKILTHGKDLMVLPIILF